MGGAIVGNAGAFGKQVSDCLKSVILYSCKGEKKEAGCEELLFNYRNSRLKESGEIVIEATFSLKHGNRDSLLKERKKIINLRKDKHPDININPSAGCIFRNIEQVSDEDDRQSAGWYLEKAGAKKLFQGGARVFNRHANIIIKSKNCTAQNVFDLSQKMAEIVKKAFGITLKLEVRFVGQFKQ